MLLLVLIFVLAAFGLLLVALVTGTAAWAWISVVVSVAAAGILVADWAKRRAAVRTNGTAERALGGPRRSVPMHIEESPTTAIPVSTPVTEPATEVFPALRQSYSAAPSAASEGRVSANSMPSGSSELPSGAESEFVRSRPRQSPSVISGAESPLKEGAEDSAPQVGDPFGGQSGVDFGKAAAAAPLVADAVQDKQSGTTPDAQPDGMSAEQPARRAGDLAAKDAPKSSGSSKQADDYSHWQPKAAEAGAQRDSAEQDSPEQDAKPDSGIKQNSGQGSERSFVPSQQTGQRPAGQPRQQPPSTSEGAAAAAAPQGTPAGQGRPPARDADRTTAISTSAVAGAGAAGLAAASIGRQDQAGPPPRTEADPTTAIPVTGGAQRSGQPGAQDKPLDRAEATQAITPVRGGPPPEPGEEKSDAAALATVSTLGDEVLVIDERPRFHLSGCRVLAGNDTIPLPAKEALEYGFSPCSVCSPVRVLASRNRAASSS